MRTTVEMSDDVRARLLQIAARNGIKGFSHLVQEALEAYLDGFDSENEKVRRAILLKGAFRERDANNMRNIILEMRGIART